MSAWTDLGLPLAESSDYQYEVDAGLLRTPFEVAQPRQTRRHTTNKRTFTFHVKLTKAQLRTAAQYLDANGYSWFSLPLLSGYTDEPIVGLCVRLTKDYTISAEGYDTYRLQMVTEQLVERSILFTTNLYPIESYDYIQISPLPDFSHTLWLSNYDYPVDQLVANQLPDFSGTLYLSATTYSPTADTLSMSNLPPFYGTSIRTNQAWSAAAEILSVSSLPAFSGSYVRTNIAHSNPYELLTVAALPNFTGTLT